MSHDTCSDLRSALRDREDHPEYGKPSAPRCTSAWIDPLGKFFPVDDCGHSHFAEFNYGTYDLESKGWVHLSFGNLYYNRIRQAQVDTLYDVLEHYEAGEYQYANHLRDSLNSALASMDF